MIATKNPFCQSFAEKSSISPKDSGKNANFIKGQWKKFKFRQRTIWKTPISPYIREKNAIIAKRIENDSTETQISFKDCEKKTQI